MEIAWMLDCGLGTVPCLSLLLAMTRRGLICHVFQQQFAMFLEEQSNRSAVSWGKRSRTVNLKKPS